MDAGGLWLVAGGRRVLSDGFFAAGFCAGFVIICHLGGLFLS